MKRCSSPAQRANQQLLSRLAKAWRDDLTDIQRRQWDLFAARDHRRKRRRTGFHTFIRANAPRVRVGQSLMKTPTLPRGCCTLSNLQIEARNRHGRFTLAAQSTPEGPLPDWFIVTATKAGSAGQKPKAHDYIVIHPNANLADLAQLGDAYLKVYRKKYGVPQPGQRLGVWISPFTGGTKSIGRYCDVVVSD